jgi:hypothetical protein
LKNLTLIHHIDSDVWCLGCNQGVEGIAQVENCYLDTSTDRSWDVSVGIDRPSLQVQDLCAEPDNGKMQRRQTTPNSAPAYLNRPPAFELLACAALSYLLRF